MTMWNPVSIRKCAHCREGRIALFTSVQKCDHCQGSGVDLSDEGLLVPIVELKTMVRTYKLLAKMGIHTLGQLIRAAAAGQMAGWENTNPGALHDLDGLLARWGLSHLLSDATPGRSKKETNP
jgi:hypothetical protein